MTPPEKVLDDDWPVTWIGHAWAFDEESFQPPLSWIRGRAFADDRLVALSRAVLTYLEYGRPADWLTEAAKPTITQAGKKNSFPLRPGGVRAVAEAADFVAEQPLLIDPCDDEPSKSLGYSFDPSHPTGIIISVGDVEDQQRGTASIFVYGLNRLRLVEDGTRLLRRLEYLGDLVIDLATSIEELETPDAIEALAGTAASAVAPRLRLLRDRTLAEMKSLTEDDAPNATMARAWMSEFKAKLA